MIITNQLFIDGIRKLSRISIYTCALIAISSGSLNDMQGHIVDLGNWLVFFNQSSLCFIWTAPDKSFSIIALHQWKFLIHHWISLSSYYPHTNYFSLAHFNLIFFLSVLVFVWLSLCESHFIKLISVTNFCFNPILFHLFCGTFSTFEAYYFQFSILILSWSMFSFFNHPVSFVIFTKC